MDTPGMRTSPEHYFRLLQERRQGELLTDTSRRVLIEDVMVECKTLTAAADLLGTSRVSLRELMMRLGIRTPREEQDILRDQAVARGLVS
jgi:hypothetical protein